MIPASSMYVAWQEWADALVARIGPLLNRLQAGEQNYSALAQFSKTALPQATKLTGMLIYVKDEAGGAVPAFSDGTNWRRVTDRAIVS